MRVITFGTFDVFHVGHLNILERAKELGNYLVVGVSSDQLNFEKKNLHSVFNQNERMRIINALDCVDEVFIEESLELKKEYILKYEASILVIGVSWLVGAAKIRIN